MQVQYCFKHKFSFRWGGGGGIYHGLRDKNFQDADSQYVTPDKDAFLKFGILTPLREESGKTHLKIYG